MSDEPKTKKVRRNSVNGQWTTLEYVEKNKRTTTTETVPVRSKTVPGAVNLPEEEQVEDEVH